MADGKKSFLLYCDIQSTINKLSDEQAGRLFKTILSYVNDENPIVDDLLLDVVFEPIKVSLKRDLKRYESIIERNRENGKLGGRPKNEEPKKPSGLNGNPKKPKKADSVIDSDSVIDTDSEKKQEVHTQTPFDVYVSWLKSTYPSVASLKTQMTSEQFDFIINTFGRDKFVSILMQMENKADLNKKYKSVYLTAYNWLKNAK